MKLRHIVSLAIVFLMVIGCDQSEAVEVTFEWDTLQVVTREGESHEFDVELALTYEQRKQGLMFREEMADDAGMLFLFDYEIPLKFWMKNTILPLDLIFVKSDGTIGHIHKDAVPFSEERISSNGNAKAVLEVNAGLTDQLNIKPGDRVIHQAFESDKPQN